MKPCFAYLRVSTLKQGEHGVSLAEQRAAIQSYADKHSLNVIEWFEEKETAAKLGRPVFNQILKRLHKQEAKALIVHKIDRSARNLKDWVAVQDLLEANIEVHFAGESVDLNSRGGRLSADIIAVVSADYVRNLKEEARKGFYGRLKQGLYPLPAPVGYIDHGKAKAKTIHPVLGPLIRRTFELYSTGRYSIKALHKEVVALGLCNKRGGPISVNGVNNILHNPFYAGLISIKCTNETFPGCHEPIISMALYKRVQAVLTGKAQPQNHKHQFLFRRLIKCAHCNYSLIAEKQKGHVYYRCHTRTCPTKGIREEVIETTVSSVQKKVQLEGPDLLILENMLKQYRSDSRERIQSTEKVFSMQLHTITEKLNRLTDAYVDGMFDKAIFEERRTSLLEQKQDAEQKLREMSDNPNAVPDNIAKILEQLKSPYSSYISGTVHEKQQILKSITSNRQATSKKLEIELKKPFQIIANLQTDTFCPPYRDRPRTLVQTFIELVEVHQSNDIV